ncbi:MAG: exodeoxyribonuclease III [Luteitalea sp.]|nr:exodeoxyribonuclease III [Luteitalea sp.]
MKILSWNVNGIRKRAGEVAELLAREAPDVACLQEIKASADLVPIALFEMAGYWSYWHGGKGYSGIALLVRRAHSARQPEFSHPDFNVEHRIATTSMGGLTIASVYVPNGGRDFPAKLRFLEAMGNYVAATRTQGESVVLCGDMNVARAEMDVHPKERKANAVGQRPDERALFERVLDQGLVDVGRTFDPDNDGLFTWWAPWRSMRQRNIGWRIDYILAATPVAGATRSSRVLAEFGTSDHAPLVAEFDV